MPRSASASIRLPADVAAWLGANAVATGRSLADEAAFRLRAMMLAEAAMRAARAARLSSSMEIVLMPAGRRAARSAARNASTA